MSLTIGFFGSAAFLEPLLHAVNESTHRLVFIVTSPDRPKGRGKVITPPEPKKFAVEHNILCLQPEKLLSDAILDELAHFNADLFLVIAYGKLFSKKVLSIPRLGCFNLHFSLLPRWRGSAPVNWAVMSGDRETGLTVMKMDSGLDTGEIVMQRSFAVGDDDTAQDVLSTMTILGQEMLPAFLDSVEAGLLACQKQEESASTYARMLKKEDGLIDWTTAAKTIHNQVRGLYPWPGAYTFCDGKRLKIIKTALVSGRDVQPGEIESVDARGAVVGTGEGSIALRDVQEEGRGIVTAAQFFTRKTCYAGSILGR